jgi:hypothetical protein
MNSKNTYNQWQRFCAASNVPKDQVKLLYDTHKSQIKTTNPTLWFNFLNKSSLQENDETSTIPENTENEDSKASQEQMMKDVYITLKEIKSFLIFLISEPSRHVKSFINLEEKTDDNVLKKWSQGMAIVMNKLKNSEEYNNTNYIIDLKQVYLLISEHLFSIPQIEKIGQVSFVNVTYESDIKIKLLFETKRKKYINEFIIPIITKNDSNINSVIFFYNTNELLSLIDNRYRSELVYNNDYITTSQNKFVEIDFFLTHMIYTVLHSMIHLYCSVIFNNSFMSHEDHNYYKSVESIVPRPLFKYFLMPNL